MSCSLLRKPSPMWRSQVGIRQFNFWCMLYIPCVSGSCLQRIARDCKALFPFAIWRGSVKLLVFLVYHVVSRILHVVRFALCSFRSKWLVPRSHFESHRPG